MPIYRIISLAAVLALGGCCKSAPELTAAGPAPIDNWVYLYARLQESQSRATAERQYLDKLRESLASYRSKIQIEEIRGAQGDIEFIGIDLQIAAPASQTDTLEELVTECLRQSAAPYATQVFVVTP